MAIVGENGAGKTTLIKHINGLLKPTTGTVLVFGTDTKTASIAQLSRRIGIVFQNPDHQLFSETVENEIAFGLRNFHIDEEKISERIAWSLDYFTLEQYRTKSPMLLSGGEKKRLCLAMVSAWDPDVLILDEPTVGQDLLQKERLSELVISIQEMGKTVILVSHDVEFLWTLQPRVVVMARGGVLDDGPAQDVFRNREKLRESNIVTPHLLELSNSLKINVTTSFKNVNDACSQILPAIRSE